MRAGRRYAAWMFPREGRRSVREGQVPAVHGAGPDADRGPSHASRDIVTPTGPNVVR
jgi:hypothetical protein